MLKVFSNNTACRHKTLASKPLKVVDTESINLCYLASRNSSRVKRNKQLWQTDGARLHRFSYMERSVFLWTSELFVDKLAFTSTNADLLLLFTHAQWPDSHVSFAPIAANHNISVTLENLEFGLCLLLSCPPPPLCSAPKYGPAS